MPPTSLPVTAFLPYEYLALLAAACWAVGSLMSATASTHLGAFAFTRWRMLCAAVMLWLIATVSGGWVTLAIDSLGLLVVSGIIGIFIGDTALFAAMNRLGPRRAGVLFATHSLFSVILAYFFLGETQWGWTLIGSSLLVSGVMTAIFFGKRKTELHAWEANQSQLKSGVALGLLAALCQAVATLMLKPLMETSIDAVSASAVRMTTAFVLHQLIFMLGFKVARAYLSMTKKVFLLVLANAALSNTITARVRNSDVTAKTMTVSATDSATVNVVSSASAISSSFGGAAMSGGGANATIANANVTLAEVDGTVSDIILTGLATVSAQSLAQLVAEVDVTSIAVGLFALAAGGGTVEEIERVDHPWVQEYFHGPRARAAQRAHAAQGG